MFALAPPTSAGANKNQPCKTVLVVCQNIRIDHSENVRWQKKGMKVGGEVSNTPRGTL